MAVLSVSAARLLAWATQQHRRPPSARTPAPPALTLHSPFPSPELGADGAFQSSAWPVRTMVFIDGSWLYYTLFERGRRCPIVQRYGAGWYHSHHVDWTAITQLISDHISAELLRMQPYNERAIEVVRVLVYSSFREDQQIGTEREKMFRALQELRAEGFAENT